jgi:hypothetical protein
MFYDENLSDFPGNFFHQRKSRFGPQPAAQGEWGKTGATTEPVRT